MEELERLKIQLDKLDSQKEQLLAEFKWFISNTPSQFSKIVYKVIYLILIKICYHNKNIKTQHLLVQQYWTFVLKLNFWLKKSLDELYVLSRLEIELPNCCTFLFIKSTVFFVFAKAPIFELLKTDYFPLFKSFFCNIIFFLSNSFFNPSIFSKLWSCLDLKATP